MASESPTRLNPSAFGLACGIFWSFGVAIIGLTARRGWGQRWEQLFADIYRGCDLLLAVNGEASHELRPAVLGTSVCTPTGCWRGHAAGIPIRQWGRGSALLTREYLGCFASVSTQSGHRTRNSTVRRFTPVVNDGSLSPQEDSETRSGIVIGAIWALFDGFSTGYTVAWLYNRFRQE